MKAILIFHIPIGHIPASQISTYLHKTADDIGLKEDCEKMDIKMLLLPIRPYTEGPTNPTITLISFDNNYKVYNIPYLKLNDEYSIINNICTRLADFMINGDIISYNGKKIQFIFNEDSVTFNEITKSGSKLIATYNLSDPAEFDPDKIVIQLRKYLRPKSLLRRILNWMTFGY